MGIREDQFVGCSFVVVNQVGQIGLFDWVDGRVIPNSTRLKV